MRRVALVLAAALLGGCPWGTMSSDELDAAYPYAKGRMFSRGVVAGVVKNLEKRVGGSFVSTGVNISADSAVFIVRDPKHPERIDTWQYIRGDFVAPTPVQTSKEDNQDSYSFPVAGLAFDRVRDMMQRALAELKIEAAHVESVYVNRQKDGPEFNVSVTGPRQKGRARFSPAGEFIAADVE